MNENENKGMTVRSEFGATEMMAAHETAATAIAAREKAAVEAKYIVARAKPRDLEDVRVRLLKECSRPGFADVARYNKPIGNGVVGPSIRFAEAALRCMTNIMPEVAVVFESPEKRILRVTVTDLESNLTYATEITLDKTVERKKLRDGQQPISKRTNSYGEVVFLVAATEDDLLNKQNALISKAIRTNGLRLIPGDIVEECMDRVVQTQRDRAAKDPDAEKRRLIDAFATIGVGPTELRSYLGHELDALQPAQMVDLRSIYTAIRDGEATWNAVMEDKGKSNKITPPKSKSESIKNVTPPKEQPPAKAESAPAVEQPPADDAGTAPAPKADESTPTQPADDTGATDNRIETIVESVKEGKRGKNPKTGKDWQIYEIKCSDDHTYKTFDSKLAGGVQQGDAVLIEYDEDRYGRTITALTVL